MKIQPYISKLSASSEYKDFVKKNNDAFLTAAFFVIDLENGKNSHVIDYYVPSKRKIAAFTLDNRVTMQMLDLVTKKAPEKLDLEINIDLDALQGILEDEMKNRNITDELKKIISVIQTIDGKKIWNLNCMLSGMGILNAHVEDATGNILRMEKKSFTDIMRKLPMEEIKKQMASAQGASAQVEKVAKAPLATESEDEEEKEPEATPEDANEQRAQIEKAIAIIEKEKSEMLKKSSKKSSLGKSRKK